MALANHAGEGLAESSSVVKPTGRRRSGDWREPIRDPARPKARNGSPYGRETE